MMDLGLQRPMTESTGGSPVQMNTLDRMRERKKNLEEQLQHTTELIELFEAHPEIERALTLMQRL